MPTAVSITNIPDGIGEPIARFQVIVVTRMRTSLLALALIRVANVCSHAAFALPREKGVNTQARHGGLEVPSSCGLLGEGPVDA